MTIKQEFINKIYYLRYYIAYKSFIIYCVATFIEATINLIRYFSSDPKQDLLLQHALVLYCYIVILGGLWLTLGRYLQKHKLYLAQDITVSVSLFLMQALSFFYIGKDLAQENASVIIQDYYIGAFWMSIPYCISIIIFNWKVQNIYLMSTLIAQAIFVSDFSSEGYYISQVYIFCLGIFTCHFKKRTTEILENYFDQLEQKYKNEKQYKKIFDELQECIILFNMKNEIVYQNQIAKQIFPGELKNKKKQTFKIEYLIIYNSDHVQVVCIDKKNQQENKQFNNISTFQNLIQGISKLLQNYEKKELYGQIHFFNNNNRENPKVILDFTISESQLISGFQLICRDVKEQIEIQNMKNAEKMQDMMLRSISHEFKTPLNGLTMFLSALEYSKEIPPPIIQKYVKPAKNCFHIIYNQINDLLDYTRFNFNNLTFSWQKINLSQIIQDNVSFLQFTAKLRHIKILTKMKDNIIIMSDSKRIQQILMSLTKQIFKKTQTGYIKLIVKRIGDASSRLFKITIQNTGKGIQNCELDELFQKSVDKNQKENIGLGLKITNILAQKLGGGEKIQTLPGENFSSISFFLKDQSVEAQEQEEELIKPNTQEFDNQNDLKGRTTFFKTMNKYMIRSKASLKKKKESCSCPKLLIVDDDDYNIYALKIILMIMNIKEEDIDHAYDGQQALQKIDERVKSDCSCFFKLIFMDINMPEMNGFECTQRLNNLMKQQKIPKVNIVSCTTDDISSNKLFSIFSDHVDKPISIQKLKQILDTYY